MSEFHHEHADETRDSPPAGDPWPLTPIGFFHGPRKYPYESPRQGNLGPAGDTGPGQVRLLPRRNYEQALGDLDGFDRIWLLFGFHNAPPVDPSAAWKPLVRPPRHANRKIGVFATRSPHRPGGLGLSAVRLVRIEGLNLFVDETDLLDGTPIFDIKPYVPAYDSFPDARAGWTESESTPATFYGVDIEAEAVEHMRFLLERGGPDLAAFARLQLERDPADGHRKRVKPNSARGEFVLAYRTWRICFTIDDATRVVAVKEVRSGYTPPEREPNAPDPYGDLDLHREFVLRFGPPVP